MFSTVEDVQSLENVQCGVILTLQIVLMVFFHSRDIPCNVLMVSLPLLIISLKVLNIFHSTYIAFMFFPTVLIISPHSSEHP